MRYSVVASFEVRGRRASHWVTREAAEECAAEANRRGILLGVDRPCPATPWAVVDTMTPPVRGESGGAS